MSNDIEREAFEKALEGEAHFWWIPEVGQYNSTITQKMWQTWRRARAQQGEAEPVALCYTYDGALAECPCCGSLDVGGANHTVRCYSCGLKIEKDGPLQNACDAWNTRSGVMPPTATADTVPMPTTTDQARAMALTGMKWLEDNAPDQIITPTATAGGVPNWMSSLRENLASQDNRITQDPLFVVFQKREIVVDEEFDHDRISWGNEYGEADDHIQGRLNEMYDDIDGDFWREDEIELTDEETGTGTYRRVALKEVDEFVTACFTEVGANDYLKANGHNLTRPHIYVTSLYRNEEMKRLREWLLSTPTTPRPEADGWIRCCERLPTVQDADEGGDIWISSPIGAVWLCSFHDGRKQGDGWHWKPTGLKRPNPPAEGE